MNLQDETSEKGLLEGHSVVASMILLYTYDLA